MALGGWFSFDAQRVSFPFFAEPASEVTAAFPTMCSSLPERSLGTSESLLWRQPFFGVFLPSFITDLKRWDKATFLPQGGSNRLFFCVPTYRFKFRALPQKTPSDTCVYIQSGTVFAETCILTAYSICQKKATLWKAQWIWRLRKKGRSPSLNSPGI